MSVFMDLWIPGKPTPKGRPRMTRRGRAYTPQTTHDAENHIYAEYIRNYGHNHTTDAPLAVYLDYDQTGQRIQIIELPEERRSPMRPDVDNLVKLSIDALGCTERRPHGAFLNDRQVVELHADKHANGFDLEHDNLKAGN